MNSGIKPLAFWGLALWALLLSVGTGRSQTWTHDLEKPSGEPAPDWIVPAPFQPATSGVSVLSYDLAPAPGRSGLLLNLVFTEVEGGFLRAFWKSGESSETLSDNLYEGIALPNQRHLLIPQELLEKGGTLIFQSSGIQLGISQIRWDWVKPEPLLSVEDQEERLLASLGVLLKKQEVQGEPALVPDDFWAGQTVTAQISEKPERIEQGVEFTVELAAAPAAVRMECYLSGLVLKDSLLFWVNGQKAGVIRPEVPDLRDPGYESRGEEGLVYRGWRKASLYLPAGLLVSGLNTLQFSPSETEGEVPSPLALKDFKLQLSFPPLKKPEAAPRASEEELVSPGELGPQ